MSFLSLDLPILTFHTNLIIKFSCACPVIYLFICMVSRFRDVEMWILLLSFHLWVILHCIGYATFCLFSHHCDIWIPHPTPNILSITDDTAVIIYSFWWGHVFSLLWCRIAMELLNWNGTLCVNTRTTRLSSRAADHLPSSPAMWQFQFLHSIQMLSPVLSLMTAIAAIFQLYR